MTNYPQRSRFLSHYLIFMLLIFCLIGCAGNSAQSTLQVEHLVRSTQAAELRITGTVQAARLQITVDYASTRLALAATQSQFIKATLVEYGTPQQALDDFQRSVSSGDIDLPTFTPRPDATATSPVIGGGDTNFLPETATPLPATGARLENIVTSTGVDNNDCATGTTARFDDTVAEIYVVATAKETPANTTFTSRWFNGSEEVATFDWTPDFAIEDACIWFFIDESDTVLAPGTWRVSMDINGTSAAAPVTFTIEAINPDA